MKNLKNISLRDTPFKHDDATMVSVSKYSVLYSMTLYNYGIKGQGNFYGRTYQSEPKPLKNSLTDSGIMELNEAEQVFFHTNYTDKSSELVVEVVVVRESNHKKTLASAGYAMCPIFDFKNQIKTSPILSGTPRQIGTPQSDRTLTQLDRTAKASLDFEIREFTELSPL